MGSDTSSDRETSRSLSPDNSKDGLGRSYECNFCKRGFTNAQALGGHMNIHRKDKAKAKQNNTFTTTTTTITKPKKDHSIVFSESFNLFPNEESQFLRGSSFGIRSGDLIGYDHFTPTNPNFPWTLAASELDHHGLHEHRLRVNLNLEIGSSEMVDNNIGNSQVGQEEWFENEVDLELRLGHYP